MDAWLSLDFVAKRYGVLPSTALKDGYDTDMICAHLAAGYENYLNKCARDGVDTSTPKPTEQQMLAMIERARNDKNRTKTKSDHRHPQS